MDHATLAMILAIWFISFHFIKLLFSQQTTKLLPPGPKPLPIIGNILEVGKKPHRSFANLAKIHGPLISLRLGSVTTIVVSSADVAKEMFLKKDHPLSNRTIPNSVTAGDHHKLTMSWLPVSPKWRNLRKITAVHLLSPQRLDACQTFRHAKVQQLYEYVQECAQKGQAVDIGKAAFTTSLNLLSKLFFSVELAHHKSHTSQEFKELIWNIMEDIGKPNYADYFPILGCVDPTGIRRRLACSFDKLIAVFQGIICERLAPDSSTTTTTTTDDVLDVLLQLFKQNELTMGEINHLLVDIFDAGTDTTSSTFEWVMTELIRNPEMMEKAQEEIKQVLGKDKQIQESDIINLPYLQAIIKETLRLHPPTVFLLPRKADTDVELYGYIVPKDAQILVNLWAIGRDPNAWQNADIFSPERFIGCEIDVKGRDFGLLPFGAGRRICPGMNLAIRMLTLMLATLLQFFNWKLEGDISPKDLDMDEKFGIALQKTKPLKLIPIPRYGSVSELIKENMHMKLYMEGTVNNHHFKCTSEGEGKPYEGTQTMRIKAVEGGPLPFAFDILATSFMYGSKTFINHTQGIPDFFKQSFPEGFTWERVTTYEDGGVLTATQDTSLQDGCLIYNVKIRGVNFPSNGPVMQKKTLGWEASTETLYPADGGLEGRADMALKLVGGGHLICNLKTTYRSKKPAKNLKMPGVYYVDRRLERIKEADKETYVEQHEVAVARYCDLPSKLGHR
nr:CYP76AD1/P450 tyrosinase/mKate2 red fluorescent protein fusion protein [Expression vector pWCD1954]